MKEGQKELSPAATGKTGDAAEAARQHPDKDDDYQGDKELNSASLEANV